MERFSQRRRGQKEDGRRRRNGILSYNNTPVSRPWPSIPSVLTFWFLELLVALSDIENMLASN